jgi:hypothetical protein
LLAEKKIFKIKVYGEKEFGMASNGTQYWLNG